VEDLSVSQPQQLDFLLEGFFQLVSLGLLTIPSFRRSIFPAEQRKSLFAFGGFNQCEWQKVAVAPLATENLFAS
jgi:hypothetical protein